MISIDWSLFFFLAAHCLYNDDGKTLYKHTHVLIGGIDASSSSSFREKIPILQIFYPAEYKPGIWSYDVALMQLATQTSAPPVTMATVAPAAGTQITKIGWGMTELNGIVNNVLR